MIKKIINLTAVTIIAFYTCSTSVFAAQYEVEQELNYAEEQKLQEFEQEAINACKEEQIQDSLLMEEYKNLEITLPTDFFQTDIETASDDSILEDASLQTLNIATYASTSTPSGIYKTGTATNTNLVYSMNTALNSYYGIYKTIQTSEYRFGSQLSDSFILPGMSTTNVMGSSCSDMVPQGIEIARGYIFITAYCYEDDHNSVIYVLDSSTKAYITTLVMPHKEHVGGIAYANYNLWVCGGSVNGKGRLYYYNFSEIKDAIEYARSNTSVKSIYLGSYTQGKVYLKNQSKTSFVTAYQNTLCVGEFYEDKSGSICIYDPIISDGYTLTATNSNTIPAKAQGALFYNTGSNIYLLITTSCGVIDNSKVYIYSTPGTQLTGTMSYKKCVELPKMVEGAIMLNGRIYFVFESCSNHWKSMINLANAAGSGKLDIVGKVCGLNTSFIFK